MVSIGSTNREIGDALSISHRTVENHVASVLRKLGVASRQEVGSPEQVTSGESGKDRWPYG
jgi:DNA-binding NarL/FixJ family response regulator